METIQEEVLKMLNIAVKEANREYKLALKERDKHTIEVAKNKYEDLANARWSLEQMIRRSN